MADELLGLRGFEPAGQVKVYDLKSHRLKRIEDADGNVIREFPKAKRETVHRPKYRCTSNLDFLLHPEIYKAEHQKLLADLDELIKDYKEFADWYEGQWELAKQNAWDKWRLIWDSKKRKFVSGDVNFELDFLYKKVQELERKLKPKIYKNVEINKTVNNELTDDEQIKLCIQCTSLKISGGTLRCAREKCKYS